MVTAPFTFIVPLVSYPRADDENTTVDEMARCMTHSHLYWMWTP